MKVAPSRSSTVKRPPIGFTGQTAGGAWPARVVHRGCEAAREIIDLEERQHRLATEQLRESRCDVSRLQRLVRGASIGCAIADSGAGCGALATGAAGAGAGWATGSLGARSHPNSTAPATAASASTASNAFVALLMRSPGRDAAAIRNASHR